MGIYSNNKMEENEIIIFSEDFPGNGEYGTYAYNLYKNLKKYNCKLLYICRQLSDTKNNDIINNANIYAIHISDYVQITNDIKNEIIPVDINLFIKENKLDKCKILLSFSPITTLLGKMLILSEKHIYLSSTILLNNHYTSDINLWNIDDSELSRLLDENHFNFFSKNNDIIILPLSPLIELIENKINNICNLNNKIEKYCLISNDNITNLALEEKLYDIIFISSDITWPIKNFELVSEIFKYYPYLKKILIGKNATKYYNNFPNTEVYELSDYATIKKFIRQTKLLLLPSLLDAAPTIVMDCISENCIPVMYNNCGFSSLFLKNENLKKYIMKSFDINEWSTAINNIIEYWKSSKKEEINMFEYLKEEINISKRIFYKTVLTYLEKEYIIDMNSHCLIIQVKDNVPTIKLHNKCTLYDLHNMLCKNVKYIYSFSELNTIMEDKKYEYYSLCDTNTILNWSKKPGSYFNTFDFIINKLKNINNFFCPSTIASKSIKKTGVINNILSFTYDSFIYDIDLFKSYLLNCDISNKIKKELYFNEDIYAYYYPFDRMSGNIDILICFYQQFYNNNLEQYTYKIYKRLMDNNIKVGIYLLGLPESCINNNFSIDNIVFDECNNLLNYIKKYNVKKIFMSYVPIHIYPQKDRDELFNYVNENNIDVYIFVAGTISHMNLYPQLYKIKKALTMGSWNKYLYKKYNINTEIYPTYFYPNLDGINLKHLSYNRITKLNKTFCHIGRLSAEKRPYFIVKAFNIFLKEIMDKEYKLYLIGGSGPTIADIKFFIKQNNIEDNVIIKEWMSYDDLQLLLKNNIDYNILASSTEGVPGVLFDTMRFGIPTISSKIHCVDEVITNDYNGLLFEYSGYDIIENEIFDNDKKITENIKKYDNENIKKMLDVLLYSSNVEIRNKLGNNCIEYMKKYKNDINVMKFFDYE